MTSRRVILKVRSEVECPLFKTGDRMVLHLPSVETEASSAVCALALAKFLGETSLANCPRTVSPIEHGTFECPRTNEPVVFDVESFAESHTPMPLVSQPPTNRSSLTDLLRRLDVFRSASANVLEQVIASLRMELYAPGSIITEKGQPARDFVVLSNGEVDVVECTNLDGTERGLRIRAPWRFGELSLLTGSPNSARIIARTSTTVFLLDGDCFHRVLRNHPSVAHRFIQVLASQVESTNSILAREGQFGFRGQLTVMNLSTVLQVLAEARRSGRLYLRSGSEFGFMGYNQGRIYTAHYDTLNGASAVYALLKWADGEFWFEHEPVPKQDQVEIGVMGLILEGMRRIDEDTTL
ncbi:MAG: DUF4388 domain-containing protein [Myxococcales bacterium]|nr:DUF4388 domain-containing protein [Myxococcales bacterium]